MNKDITELKNNNDDREQSHIRIAELKKENEELKKQTERVLNNAKEIVIRVETENQKLRAQMSPSISGSSPSRAGDETPECSATPSLKRARDSTETEKENVSEVSEEGQQKKPKFEG